MNDCPERHFILTSRFDRVVRQGRVELVLVSGYSGVGKSSVVNELHRALVPPRAHFAFGKFDQYKRDIPYATLAQAFQSLVREILGKSDTQIGGWRQGLRDALGPNGQRMVNLIPRTVISAGAPTARCSSSIGFTRIWPLRRGKVRPHSTPPSARRLGSWTPRL